MVARLPLGDRSTPHEIRGHAVVVRQLRERRVAQGVDPAVTDVDDREVLVSGQTRGTDGRPHAFEVGARVRTIPDRPVRRPDRGTELDGRLPGEGRVDQGDRDRGRDLTAGRTPHAVGDDGEVIAAGDRVLEGVADASDVGTVRSAELHRGFLSAAFAGVGARRLDRQEMAGDGEGPLAVGGVALHPLGPGIEAIGRRVGQEHSDLGERHAGGSQRVDQARVAELSGRVVPVARSRVDRRRNEESTGRVAPEALRREPGALRELADRHEIVHGSQHEPSPRVRVKCLPA